MEPNNNENQTSPEPAAPVENTETATKTATEQATAPVVASKDDGEVNMKKLYAIGGYILPFLFFLPLLDEKCKHDQFSLFHANQQLNVLAAWIIIQLFVMNAVYMMLSPAFGLYAVASLISSALTIGLFVLSIMGIISAANGTMKRLPLIGQFNFLNQLVK